MLDDLGHPGRPAARRSDGSSLGGVGDAEAAAEVELGQLDAELARRPARAGRAPGGRPPRSPRCRRSGCRCGSAGRAARARGGSSTRRTASTASPPVIEKPNFWSSWAVAMYSWVCASTRRSPAPSPARRTPSSAATRGQPLDLVERVDDDPADARARAPRRSSASDLLLPWKPIRAGSKPGPQRDGELAAGADVEAEALLGHPAGDRRAEERLAGVEDVVRRRTASRKASGTPARPGSRPRRGRRPGCRTRRPGRGTSTPPTRSAAVGLARASADHSGRTRALRSSGARSHDGPRRALGVERAGLVRAHATSARAPRRRAGRGRWPARLRVASSSQQPGPVQVGRAPRRPGAAPGSRRRTGGTRPASVLEVARDPVRLAQLGGLRDHARELAEHARAASPSVSWSAATGRSRPRSQPIPSVGGVAHDRSVRAWAYCT